MNKDLYNDVMTVEGVNEVDSEDEYFAAMQRQINAGCWSLQGSHGRAMMDAITAGRCLLGKVRARDYYGNVIPSRDDVKPGTKGSRAFVAEQCGEDWANVMEVQP